MWPDSADTVVTPTHDDPPPAAQPFRQFILKVHGRCDLACDYCYVYAMADQRWRARPAVMPEQVVARTAARIAEHLRAHRLDRVDVVLHGGEPLLAGADMLAGTVRAIRAEVGGSAGVRFCVQTNGVRLNARLLRVLARERVSVSVSLDGDRAAHDRHRRRHDGRGSHDLVDAALRRLSSPEHRHLFAGLLCAVDLRNDPVATYEALLAYGPPAVDFLLPHGNWTAPPPGRSPDAAGSPYGDWLVAVFDRWYRSPSREVRVRMFDEIINVLLGGSSRLDGIGLSPLAAVVVETDGTIDSGDTLKSAHAGAGDTGLDVSRHSFDDALRLPQVRLRQAGIAALGAPCDRCPVRRTCGGGLYAHRYRAGSGFANPSVYCPDLLRLITHIRATLDGDLARLRGAAR
jgi:uncharacterized protein